MGVGGASTLGNRTLGEILADCLTYAYEPMTKKKMIFYYNTTWLVYNLDLGEYWPLNRSLNYYTILQLELVC